MGVKGGRSLALAVAAGAALSFVVLALTVRAGATLPFDNWSRAMSKANSAPGLTAIAMAASFLGRLAVLIPATILIAGGFFLRGRRGAGLALVTAMSGAIILNGLLKTALHRARPPPFFGVDPESFSFPSGHAFFALTFCGALLLILAAYRKLSPLTAGLGAVLVIAIGWSRIYLGVHYPSDVAAGLLAGTAWLAALFRLGLFRFESAS
jgi:undecaprenyl-diphosphatase